MQAGKGRVRVVEDALGFGYTRAARLINLMVDAMVIRETPESVDWPVVMSAEEWQYAKDNLGKAVSVDQGRDSAPGDTQADAPTLPTSPAKEPWQMTKAEYVAAVLSGEQDFTPLGRNPTSNKTLRTVGNVEELRRRAERNHDAEVTTAFAENKPVPAEILAEYDLPPKDAAPVEDANKPKTFADYMTGPSGQFWGPRLAQFMELPAEERARLAVDAMEYIGNKIKTLRGEKPATLTATQWEARVRKSQKSREIKELQDNGKMWIELRAQALQEQKPIAPAGSGGPAPIIGGITEAIGQSIEQHEAKVSNLRYGTPGQILFEYDGKTYTAPEPKDVMPVGSPEGNRWAAWKVVKQEATPVAATQDANTPDKPLPRESLKQLALKVEMADRKADVSAPMQEMTRLLAELAAQGTLTNADLGTVKGTLTKAQIESAIGRKVYGLSTNPSLEKRYDLDTLKTMAQTINATQLAQTPNYRQQIREGRSKEFAQRVAFEQLMSEASKQPADAAFAYDLQVPKAQDPAQTTPPPDTSMPPAANRGEIRFSERQNKSEINGVKGDAIRVTKEGSDVTLILQRDDDNKEWRVYQQTRTGKKTDYRFVDTFKNLREARALAAKVLHHNLLDDTPIESRAMPVPERTVLLKDALPVKRDIADATPYYTDGRIMFLREAVDAKQQRDLDAIPTETDTYGKVMSAVPAKTLQDLWDEMVPKSEVPAQPMAFAFDVARDIIWLDAGGKMAWAVDASKFDAVRQATGATEFRVPAKSSVPFPKAPGVVFLKDGKPVGLLVPLNQQNSVANLRGKMDTTTAKYSEPTIARKAEDDDDVEPTAITPDDPPPVDDGDAADAVPELPASTPEREETIESIVAMAREVDQRQQGPIVESRRLLGSDGKWHTADSFPIGVKHTGEVKVVGYVATRKDGVSVGTMMPTREAIEQARAERQQERDEDFRKALVAMPDDQLQSQMNVWLKETGRAQRIDGGPTPAAATPVRTAPNDVVPVADMTRAALLEELKRREGNAWSETGRLNPRTNLRQPWKNVPLSDLRKMVTQQRSADEAKATMEAQRPLMTAIESALQRAGRAYRAAGKKMLERAGVSASLPDSQTRGELAALITKRLAEAGKTPEDVIALEAEQFNEGRSEANAEAAAARRLQELGTTHVPGVRLADAEQAGRVWEATQRGDVSKLEWMKYADDLYKSNKATRPPLTSVEVGDVVFLDQDNRPAVFGRVIKAGEGADPYVTFESLGQTYAGPLSRLYRRPFQHEPTHELFTPVAMLEYEAAQAASPKPSTPVEAPVAAPAAPVAPAATPTPAPKPDTVSTTTPRDQGVANKKVRDEVIQAMIDQSERSNAMMGVITSNFREEVIVVNELLARQQTPEARWMVVQASMELLKDNQPMRRAVMEAAVRLFPEVREYALQRQDSKTLTPVEARHLEWLAWTRPEPVITAEEAERQATQRAAELSRKVANTMTPYRDTGKTAAQSMYAPRTKPESAFLGDGYTFVPRAEIVAGNDKSVASLDKSAVKEAAKHAKKSTKDWYVSEKFGTELWESVTTRITKGEMASVTVPSVVRYKEYKDGDPHAIVVPADETVGVQMVEMDAVHAMNRLVQPDNYGLVQHVLANGDVLPVLVGMRGSRPVGLVATVSRDAFPVTDADVRAGPSGAVNVADSGPPPAKSPTSEVFIAPPKPIAVTADGVQIPAQRLQPKLDALATRVKEMVQAQAEQQSLMDYEREVTSRPWWQAKQAAERLGPVRIDEVVDTQLRQQYGDDLAQMYKNVVGKKAPKLSDDKNRRIAQTKEMYAEIRNALTTQQATDFAKRYQEAMGVPPPPLANMETHRQVLLDHANRDTWTEDAKEGRPLPGEVLPTYMTAEEIKKQRNAMGDPGRTSPNHSMEAPSAAMGRDRNLLVERAVKLGTAEYRLKLVPADSDEAKSVERSTHAIDVNNVDSHPLQRLIRELDEFDDDPHVIAGDSPDIVVWNDGGGTEYRLVVAHNLTPGTRIYVDPLLFKDAPSKGVVLLARERGEEMDKAFQTERSNVIKRQEKARKSEWAKQRPDYPSLSIADLEQVARGRGLSVEGGRRGILERLDAADDVLALQQTLQKKLGPHVTAERVEASTQLERDLSALLKRAGIRTVWVKIDGDGGAVEGVYLGRGDNRVYVRAGMTDDKVASVVLHEAMHRLRTDKPELYQAVVKAVGEQSIAGFATLYGRRLARSLGAKHPFVEQFQNSPDMQQDEGVADAVGSMANDQAVRDAINKRPGLWTRIKAWVTAFLERMGYGNEGAGLRKAVLDLMRKMHDMADTVREDADGGAAADPRMALSKERLSEDADIQQQQREVDAANEADTQEALREYGNRPHMQAMVQETARNYRRMNAIVSEVRTHLTKDGGVVANAEDTTRYVVSRNTYPGGLPWRVSTFRKDAEGQWYPSGHVETKALDVPGSHGLYPEGAVQEVAHSLRMDRSEAGQERPDVRFSIDDRPLSRKVSKVLGKWTKYLTPQEMGKLKTNTATALVDAIGRIPTVREMVAIAWAGRAMRGWYRESASTIYRVFGPDSDRFAGLLAALSPRVPVDRNLSNALLVWKNWVRAGRPTDENAILAVLEQSLGRNVLGAYRNNTVSILGADDPSTVVLSGPKVNNFMLDLRGHVHAVTLDAWMATYAMLDQDVFAGGINVSGTDPGMGPTYLAFTAKIREVAEKFEVLTGDKWTAVEVQETLWSFTKTLTELSRKTGRTALDLIKNRELTDDIIRSAPVFSTLFNLPENRQLLIDAGLRPPAKHRPAVGNHGLAGRGKSGTGREAAPFARRTQQAFEERAARRLDKVGWMQRGSDDASFSVSGQPIPARGTDNPASLSDTDIMSYEQSYRSVLDTYFDPVTGRALKRSRVDPANPDQLQIGMWRFGPMGGGGIYGRNIEQLRTVDPSKLQLTESDYTDPRQNDEGRGDDARRYAEWNREGMTPPPISVIEMEDGTMRVTDGHRRVAAAKMAGTPLRAWVSPPMNTGRQDSAGKPIYTSLTLEGAKFGAEAAYKAWEGMNQAQRERRVPPTWAEWTRSKETDGLLFSVNGEPVANSDPFQTEAWKAWFGASKAVDDNGRPLRLVHGSRRVDRVGTRFLKSRATSGPMPFFTPDTTIASSYAFNKQDTSLERPTSYTEWFKFKVPGTRREVSLEKAWYHLPADVRAKVAANLPHVTNQDAEGNDVGAYRLGDSTEWGLADGGHWAYTIRKHRGNVLAAAVDVWLDSGSLFNSEHEFLDVLRIAGFPMNRVRLDDPEASAAGLIPVYMSIQNPLDTRNVPSEVVDALERASRRQPMPKFTDGADQWDKRTRNPHEWVRQLREDVANGKNSMVWTSIPDWVTRTLKMLGYDGIHDKGGKLSGHDHDVWIPFEGTQTKSAYGNDGSYGLDTNDLRFSVSGMPASTGGGDQTDTPEFKAWFGDSKVVDANGKPRVMYHGTTASFTVFRPSDAPGWGKGIYLSDNAEQVADEFAGPDGVVMPVYVSLQNPYVDKGQGFTDIVDRVKATKAWREYQERHPESHLHDVLSESGGFVNTVLRELGYDGVIAENSNSIDGLEVVAFRPEQVKSATGNVGTFDPTNPDIRFSVSGKPVPSRKEVVADAKALGLLAIGTTESIANRVRILKADPSTWTRADFDAVKDSLAIHQDVRPGSDERVASIMRDGLRSGMVDSVGAMDRKAWTWAKQLMGGDVYVFSRMMLDFFGDSAWLKPGNKPLFHFKAEKGQDLYEAMTGLRKGDNRNPQVDTPQFKQWMGDSKVVDAQGRPLMVFHQTPQHNWKSGDTKPGEFTKFDRMAVVKAGIRPVSMDNVGSWFAASPDGPWGDVTYPVYLSIQNPWTTTWDNFIAKLNETAGRAMHTKGPLKGRPADGRPIGRVDPEPLRSWLKQNGYDGIKFPATEEIDGVKADVWVTLEDTQIKSAYGNDGTYGRDTGEIRFSVSGKPVSKQFVPGGPLVNMGGKRLSLGNTHIDVIASPDNPSIGYITGLTGSRIASHLNEIAAALEAEGFSDIDYRPDAADGRDKARLRLFEQLRTAAKASKATTTGEGPDIHFSVSGKPATASQWADEAAAKPLAKDEERPAVADVEAAKLVVADMVKSGTLKPAEAKAAAEKVLKGVDGARVQPASVLARRVAARLEKVANPTGNDVEQAFREVAFAHVTNAADVALRGAKRAEADASVGTSRDSRIREMERLQGLERSYRKAADEYKPESAKGKEESPDATRDRLLRRPAAPDRPVNVPAAAAVMKQSLLAAGLEVAVKAVAKKAAGKKVGRKSIYQFVDEAIGTRPVLRQQRDAVNRVARGFLRDVGALGKPNPADPAPGTPEYKTVMGERVEEAYRQAVSDLQTSAAARRQQADARAGAIREGMSPAEGMVSASDAAKASYRAQERLGRKMASTAARTVVAAMRQARQAARAEATAKVASLQRRWQRRFDRLKDKVWTARTDLTAEQQRTRARRRLEREIRRELTDVIRKYMPRSLRGDYITMVRDATNPGRLNDALVAIQHDLTFHNAKEATRLGLQTAKGKWVERIRGDKAAKAAYDAAVQTLKDAARRLKETNTVAKQPQPAKLTTMAGGTGSVGTATKRMSVDDLLALQDRVEQAHAELLFLRKDAAEKEQIRVEGKVLARETVVESVLKSLALRPDLARPLGLPAATRTSLLGRYHIANATPDTIAAMLRNPLARKLLVEELWRGETDAMADTYAATDEMKRLLAAAGFEWGSEKLHRLSYTSAGPDAQQMTLNLPDAGKITASPGEWMAVLATLARESSGRKILEEGRPITFGRDTHMTPVTLTAADADAISDALDKMGLVSVVHGGMKFMSGTADALNKAYYSATGRYLKLEPLYFPTHVNRDQQPIENLIGAGPQYVRRALENLGFLQPTDERATSPYLIKDFFDEYNQYTHASAIMVHMTDRVRAMEAVFKDRRILAEIERKFGSDMNERLDRMIEAGKLLFSEPKSRLDKVAVSLGRKIAKAELTLNPGTWMKQFGSVPKLYAVMDAEHIASGIESMMDPVVTELLKNDAYFRNRIEDAVYRRMSPSDYKRSPSLGQVNTADAIKRIMEGGVFVTERSRAAWGSATDRIEVMNWFDGISSRVAIGAALSMGKAKGLTGQALLRYAAWEAQMAIRRVNNTSSVLDMSGWAERNRGNWLSLSMLFTSDANKNYNLIAAAFESQGGKVAGKKMGRAIVAIAASNLWGAMIGALINTLTRYGLSALFDDDEAREALLGDVGSQFVRSNLGSLYFGDVIYDLTRAGYRVATKQPVQVNSVFETPVSSKVADATEGAIRFAKSFEAQGRFTSGRNRGEYRDEVMYREGLWQMAEAISGLMGNPVLPWMRYLRKYMQQE